MRCEVLVLGIGNVLWADEGFGVRAVEALHAAYAFPAGVDAAGRRHARPHACTSRSACARRVLVFDAIDFGLPPGTLRVLRDAEVPAWGRTKLSPHQTGFNDVLALAQLNGRAPEAIVAIGVQPVELDDFGGSLTRAGQGAPCRGRALAAQRARGVGLSRHAARRRRCRVRAAERRPAGARRLRVRAAVRAPTPAASAIRACSHSLTPGERLTCASACPCRSLAPSDGVALCEGRGQRERST